MAHRKRDRKPSTSPETVPAGGETSAEDRRIADRLDGLSPTEAESVIERAIHLQSEADHNDSVDRAVLEQVADELGISREHLERALAEQRRDITAGSRADADWFDRLLGIRASTSR